MPRDYKMEICSICGVNNYRTKYIKKSTVFNFSPHEYCLKYKCCSECLKILSVNKECEFCAQIFSYHPVYEKPMHKVCSRLFLFAFESPEELSFFMEKNIDIYGDFIKETICHDKIALLDIETKSEVYIHHNNTIEDSTDYRTLYAIVPMLHFNDYMSYYKKIFNKMESYSGKNLYYDEENTDYGESIESELNSINLIDYKVI